MNYEAQLRRKNHTLKQLLGSLADEVHPILGMEDPAHYRCKVNAAFGLDRKGNPVMGRYEKNSHRIVQAPSCMIEDEKACEIEEAVFSMLRSFHLRVYDEDSGYGYLRHIQIRRGWATGQYMVTLVCTDPVFPSRQNFVRALRRQFPEISTVVLNINDRHTSMVLGERNIILYGRGYIEDELCGCTFRISPGSFYQVNPPQAEKLYETALRYANLTGKEQVLDAYCGTGTIGTIAASRAKQVTGVELNAEAVRDAVWNARRNQVKNIRFVRMDATDYMFDSDERSKTFAKMQDILNEEVRCVPLINTYNITAFHDYVQGIQGTPIEYLIQWKEWY
jgi:23S rRNA (uracil1939-C5)-methyltransferase